MTTGRTTTGPTACWMAEPSGGTLTAQTEPIHVVAARKASSSAGLCSTSTTLGTRTRVSGGTPRRAELRPLTSYVWCKHVHCLRCGGTGARATRTRKWPSTARIAEEDGDRVGGLYPTPRGAVRTATNRKVALRVPRFRCAAREGRAAAARRDVQPPRQSRRAFKNAAGPRRRSICVEIKQ